MKRVAIAYALVTLAAGSSRAADLTIDMSAVPSGAVRAETVGTKVRVHVPEKGVVTFVDPSLHPSYSAAGELVVTVDAGAQPPAITATGSVVKLTFGSGVPGAVVAAPAPPQSTPASTAPAPQAAAPVSPPVAAQVTAAVQNFQNYTVDMSVPTSPAFAVLGSTPKTIVEPGEPRDFAVSLVSKLSNSDALGNGVGFDIAPYMMLYGKTLTIQDYWHSASIRLLARTQLSFGAVKSGSDSNKTTRAALGVAIPLYDEGDPRAEKGPLADCLNKALEDMLKDPRASAADKALDAGDTEGVKKAMQAVADALAAASAACRDDFRKKHWNATRWTFGAGQAFENTHDNGTTSANGSFWTTYAMRLGSLTADGPQGQLLFHLRGTNREHVDNTTDPRGFSLRRSLLAALGTKFGSEQFNFSVEGSAKRAHYDTGERETSRKLAFGSEYKINKDMWLVLSVGGEGDLLHGKNSPFVLGSIKYGLGSESTGSFGGGKP